MPMIVRLTVVCFITLIVGLPANGEPVDRQRLFQIDESLWIVFYDLPSRRFRDIKDAYIRRDLSSARRDLATSANYLRIEAARSPIARALTDAATELDAMAAELDPLDTDPADPDARFANVHWLLSQHFLALAIDARDDNRHMDAGWYLTAVAHHLERTALWSEVAVDRKLIVAVDGLREQANKLQNAPPSARKEELYKNRPMRNAVEVLQRLGKQIGKRSLISFSP